MPTSRTERAAVGESGSLSTSRLAFITRSLLNVNSDITWVDIGDWRIARVIEKAAEEYLGREAKIVGIAGGPPEVLSIVAPVGNTTYCAFAQRHYEWQAMLKTLGVMEFEGREQRVMTAKQHLMRLAADYLLQFGLHGDAARAFIYSWYVKTNSTTRLSGVASGLMEQFLDLDVTEGSLPDAGFPIAHELGHAAQETDPEVLSILERLMRQALQKISDTVPEEDRTEARLASLAEELRADYYGVEILLRALARAIPQPTSNFNAFCGEMAANLWVMMIMEECKEMARAASMSMSADEIRKRLDRLSRPWSYLLRKELIFLGIRADMSHTNGGKLDRLLDFASNFRRAEYLQLRAGLHSAWRDMCHGMLKLTGNPYREYDDFLLSACYALARLNEDFAPTAREFVTRARSMNAQSSDGEQLIDALDRVCPADVPLVPRAPQLFGNVHP
jgi:hypothetical protein